MISHYSQHAEAYAIATRDVDMTVLHASFLNLLPPTSRVLDAGCGSGRDALAFQRAGHEVVAFDASPELASQSSQHTGRPVHVIDVLSLADASQLGLPAGTLFNGIWACASLLHVAEADQPSAWARLWAFLAPGGVIYASYKLGEHERVDELGRPFTDATEQRVLAWVRPLTGFAQLRAWISSDQQRRASLAWINVLVQRQAHAHDVPARTEP